MESRSYKEIIGQRCEGLRGRPSYSSTGRKDAPQSKSSSRDGTIKELKGFERGAEGKQEVMIKSE